MYIATSLLPVLLWCIADFAQYDGGVKLIDGIGHTLRLHSTHSGVVFRSLLILTALAKLQERYSNEITTMNLHELAAGLFGNFSKDDGVRQMVVNIFDACVSYPQGRAKIQSSIECMAVLNKVNLKVYITHKASTASSRPLAPSSRAAAAPSRGQSTVTREYMLSGRDGDGGDEDTATGAPGAGERYLYMTDEKAELEAAAQQVRVPII